MWEWQQEIYQTRPLDYENSRALTRVLPAGLYPESMSYTWLKARHDLRFGDIMERVLYNAVFGAHEPAGRRT